jgi:phosphomannomutase
MPRYHIAKSTVVVEKTKIKPMLQWLKSKEKTARIDTNDGLRFDWPKQAPTTSWAHVRESNTEPLVRIICEAPDAAEAERIQKSLRAEILSVTAAL